MKTTLLRAIGGRYGGRGTLVVIAMMVWCAESACAHLSSQAGQMENGQAGPGYASVFLPPGHWAAAAARRLDTMGLAGGWVDSATRTPAVREVAIALIIAAGAGDSARSKLASGYLARLREEFPAEVGAIDRGEIKGGLAGGNSLGMGFGEIEGGALVDARRPLSFQESSGTVLTGSIGVLATQSLAGRVVYDVGEGGAKLREAYAVVGRGATTVWAGRRRLGFGPARSGGVVLNDSTAFVGAGVIVLRRKERLAWVFRHLGEVRAEMFLSRVEDNGFRRPWLGGLRATIAPHARIRIGGNRAALFGGEGNEPTSLKNLVYLLAGEHSATGNFANQLASVDFWIRPPLGPVPLSAYFEWGFEDSAGAWLEAPGIVGGVLLAALPGLPTTELAVEGTWFSQGRPWRLDWYRHSAFSKGWTRDGVPLGHPLGGHGTEWTLFGRSDLREATVRIAWRLAWRERREGNLFAPERAGRARLVSLDVEWRVRPGAEITAAGSLENGEEWGARAWSLGLRALF